MPWVRLANFLHSITVSRRVLSRNLSSMSRSAEPRLSASLVLVNAQNEVLLVERQQAATSFAGMHVFPGGNFEAAEDGSLEAAAIRETFEETGLLLGHQSEGATPLTQDALTNARRAVHAHTLSFKHFCTQHHIAPSAELLPFSQWITPPTSPRRFHVHFFLAFLRERAAAADTLLHAVAPDGDGGLEVVRAHFVHPRDAIAQQQAGTVLLMPPQFYVLHTLARVLVGSRNTEQQRALLQRVAHGPFGARIFTPSAVNVPGVPDGWKALAYEGDEARGGRSGDKHRSVVVFGKGGIVTRIRLESNINVFNVELPEFPKL